MFYLIFTLPTFPHTLNAAVGMLGNLATGLTIDAYGPVCDNAGGIAEMSEFDAQVR